MATGLTLRLTDVERATLQLSLERYATDRRDVAADVAAERAAYQQKAVQIANELNTLPRDGDHALELTAESQLVCMAALTNRIYGARDAAWRAESHGDLKLGAEWRTAALHLESLMMRLGGHEAVEMGPIDEPTREPEDGEFGPGTLHGGWAG